MMKGLIIRLKILHLPTDIAGQASTTAKAQRELGYISHSLAYSHPFQYPIDFVIRRTSNRWKNGIIKLKTFMKIAEKYDVYHYHNGSVLIPNMMDVRYLKLRKKRLMVEFWGSDIRLPDLESQRNPYFNNSKNISAEKNRTRMARWSELTQGEVIIPDHTFNIFLEKYFNKIHVVRQSVDINNYPVSYPDPEQKRPKILHAPSHRGIKGTEYIEKAVENLKKKRLNFEYIRVEGVSHSDAIKLYRTADLIVDQLCIGAHGIFACEAMALGKPVICYILPELIQGYPEGFPIINANPDTIESVLEEWILKPEERYLIGVKSRKYVERVHDSRTIAQKLIDIYNRKY